MNNIYGILPKYNLNRCGIATLLSACSLFFVPVLVPSAKAQIISVVSGRVRDQQGLALAGVALRLKNSETGRNRYAQSDPTGLYRIAGLLAGTYEITASKAGFSDKLLSGVEVPTNASVDLDILLSVASVQSEITVSGSAQLETENSSSGAMITRRQINEMPLNGRNYLDLLQLVPGVVLNRQAAIGSDTATPILGERAGNAQFLIDGLPNSDQINGGAAAPFNQESILEFQVITSGYKAEFGHASGGIINVVSKSGSNDFHGAASLFHRNYYLDSSDLSGQKSAPFLLRWDPSGQFGGPLVKTRAFFFASAERILESRDLNFQFPARTPETLILFESPFNDHSRTFDTRFRAKLDQQVGRNWFSEQVNLTNTHITDFLPLSEATHLPSTRTNADAGRLMIGASDVALLGDAGNPFVLNFYGQYRGEPGGIYPSHPQAGAASTLFNLFDSYNSGQITGNRGQVIFGPGFTPFTLDPKYASLGTSLARQNGAHGWKVGWDFQRMIADGTESNNIFNQLFATVSDFDRFGPVDSGVNSSRIRAQVHLRKAGFTSAITTMASTCRMTGSLRALSP